MDEVFLCPIMNLPKKYGVYQVKRCPFCESIATAKNKQDIPVCHRHKSELIEDIKCQCGFFLELKIGKFGPFFICPKCGTINFEKAMLNRYLND